MFYNLNAYLTDFNLKFTSNLNGQLYNQSSLLTEESAVSRKDSNLQKDSPVS